MLLALVWFTTSCQKDDHELGNLLSKSQIDFEVVQDLAADPGGNTVILKNNTPETVAMWDYGTGRSNRTTDTVRFPFKGSYEIKFSALTAGGVVEMDPVEVTVTEDNFDYISDPLWTFLTGGVGNEKTWILDYGNYGIFAGPLSYYEPQTTWTEIQDGTAKLGWAPSWSDNQWIIPAADTASRMTFRLVNGAFLNTHKVTEGVDEQGTFFLNANAKTISTTDATILRSAGFIANASNWNNDLVLLSLTEDQLQIGVRRTNNEGDYLYVWNFVSKEYADNYVPEDPGDPEPDEGFDPQFEAGELLEMLTGGVSSGRIWKLDVDGNPVDWVKAGIGWTTDAGSSFDWGWNATWVAAVEDSWIRFDRWGGQNYTRFQDGVEVSGTFTINEETNEITLTDNTLLQNPGHWMNPTTNTIKVVKAFPDEFGDKGIWFGTGYNSDADEWLAFHYIIPQ